MTQLSARSIQLISAACESDDVAVMTEALSTTSQVSAINNKFSNLDYAWMIALKLNSAKILAWMLEHGAKPRLASLGTHLVAGGSEGATIEIVQLLLDNGWDINRRRRNSLIADAQPLLWFIVNDGDFVAWALNHGALVVPNDFDAFGPSDRLSSDFYNCRPLLEQAAAHATVATFELLRARGAPLGPCCLHKAVQSATFAYSQEARQPQETQRDSQMSDCDRAKTWTERMNMVRHLVDNLGYDVNAGDDLEHGRQIPGRCGEPIAYVGGVMSGAPDAQELVYFLLDRGAHTSNWATGRQGPPEFVDIVKRWKTHNAHAGEPFVIRGDIAIR